MVYIVLFHYFIYGKITIVVTFEQPTLGRSSDTSIKLQNIVNWKKCIEI